MVLHARSHTTTGAVRTQQISYPIPTENYSHIPTPPSPKKQLSPSKSHSTRRRPSLTTSITWLSRVSTSSSNSSNANATAYAPSKPIRISEPRLQSTFDIMTQQRSGTLGTGATVVRTPQEALYAADNEVSPDVGVSQFEADEEPVQEPPYSPPLPPIPDDVEDDEGYSAPTSRSSTPSKPTRPPPPVPFPESEEPAPEITSTIAAPLPPLRPALKVLAPPASDFYPPAVPALPTNIPSSPPAPLFEPILVSPAPTGAIDRLKIIVSLETSTATHRTTLSTLTSRPSFLASYLGSVLAREREADEASVHSHLSEAESAFHSIFHNHLTSSGLLPASSTSMHVFLDRPSAPYAHILTYLRSPPSTPEHPAVLPRGVQLTSSSSARLEALLELRDEARYLDLDELYKLCTDELRLRHTMRTHSRAFSSVSASSGSLRSLKSLGTLREEGGKVNGVGEHGQRFSKDSGVAASPRSSVVGEVGWHEAGVTGGGLKQRMLFRGRSEDGGRTVVGDWI